MRKRVTLLVLLAAGFAQSARAQPTVQMWAAGGGARPAVLPPGDLWVNPTGQLDIYLQIIDEYGQAVPNISMTIGGVGATFSDGGHNHGGGPGCCGSVSPSSGSTGDGSGFKTRYTAGTGAMSVYFYVSFLYGGDTYFIATVIPFVFPKSRMTTPGRMPTRISSSWWAARRPIHRITTPNLD